MGIFVQSRDRGTERRAALLREAGRRLVKSRGSSTPSALPEQKQGLRAPPSPLLLKGSPGVNSTSLPRDFLDPGQADGVGTCLLQDPRQFRYLVKFERPWARSLLSWGAISGAWAAGGGAGVVGVLEASPPAGRLWTGETRYHSHKQLCVVPGSPAIPWAETHCQPHLQMGKQRLWRLSILSQVRQ